MPKAGLIGSSYQMRSLNFNAERTINLMPIMSEVPDSKDVAALYGTPGLVLFASVGGGPQRGLITCGNGRTFCLSGAELYELNSDGTSVLRGTVSTFNGVVTMAENGLQLMIATSPNGYIFTFATNGFVQITDPEFPGANYVVFQDGYFIVAPPNNLGSFYISDLYDGLSWDPLNFATAESSPDGLIAPFSNAGQLFLFGDRTTEIWYNNGSVDFPYSRLSGGRMEIGCAAQNSISKADNTVFFVGKDDNGTGIVYRLTGNIPLRVSTQAVEYRLAQVSNISDLVGFVYQQEGHLFYVLTGSNMETSFVYDIATKQWHERAYLDNGDYQQWLAVFHTFNFDKNLVGDRTNGNIYSLDLDTYTDNGDPIKRTRVFTHLYAEGARFPVSDLQVDFEGGVGLEYGQGENPLAWLRMSRDFGHTWSSEYQAPIGAQGNYTTQAQWRRLGVQKQMTFEVSISDPVKVAIIGARFNSGRQ